MLPTLPLELWEHIINFLHRNETLHINIEDGREYVTFITHEGIRRGDSFHLSFEELPPSVGNYDGRWGNYYLFRMFRNGNVLVMAPVATDDMPSLWPVIGSVLEKKIPKYHGHAIARMFQDYIDTNVVISRSSLVAEADEDYPEAYLTVAETSFLKRGSIPKNGGIFYKIFSPPNPVRVATVSVDE